MAVNDQRPTEYHVDSWSKRQGRWEVVESDQPFAIVDVETQTALVPTATTAARRAGRLHEAVRAAVGRQRLSNDLSHALEELRLDRIAQANNMRTAERFDELVWALHERTRAAQSAPDAQSARRESALGWLETVASACTPESVAAGKPVLRQPVSDTLAQYFEACNSVLSAAERTLLSRSAAELMQSPESGTRERLARQLVGVFGEGSAVEYETRRVNQLRQAIEGKHRADAQRRAEQAEGESNDEEMDGEDAESLDSKNRDSRNTKPSSRQLRVKSNRIGNMEIHRHVDRSQPSSPVRRPRGADEIGQIPDRWERWSEDKHVFQSRRPGGAVLIDLSGSMGWDLKELRLLVKKLPAVTIAAYYGDDGGSGGRLCILASNGAWRYVDPAELTWRGNGVDLEALQWLSEQRGPRVWLSDGMMIGGLVSSLGSARARRAAQQIANKANIVRARDLNAAVRYLRTHGSRNVRGVFPATAREFSTA